MNKQTRNIDGTRMRSFLRNVKKTEADLIIKSSSGIAMAVCKS